MGVYKGTEKIGGVTLVGLDYEPDWDSKELLTLTTTAQTIAQDGWVTGYIASTTSGNVRIYINGVNVAYGDNASDVRGSAQIGLFRVSKGDTIYYSGSLYSQSVYFVPARKVSTTGLSGTYITESGQDSNGYFYRKWSDGLKECWGRAATNPIALPVEFSDTDYVMNLNYEGTGFAFVYGATAEKTTTSYKYKWGNGTNLSEQTAAISYINFHAIGY